MAQNKSGRKRRYILSTIVIAGLMALGTTASLAQGRSGHGGGGVGAASSNSGGQSSGRGNAQGMANTNGPNAVDRDVGRDRAEDRMSEQGLAHNRAGIRDTDAVVASRNLDGSVSRTTRLAADNRAAHGANKAGFCPPGQAKKSGSGSRFNC